jgi:hypothetical protein
MWFYYEINPPEDLDSARYYFNSICEYTHRFAFHQESALGHLVHHAVRKNNCTTFAKVSPQDQALRECQQAYSILRNELVNIESYRTMATAYWTPLNQKFPTDAGLASSFKDPSSDVSIFKLLTLDVAVARLWAYLSRKCGLTDLAAIPVDAPRTIGGDMIGAARVARLFRWTIRPSAADPDGWAGQPYDRQTGLVRNEWIAEAEAGRPHAIPRPSDAARTVIYTQSHVHPPQIVSTTMQPQVRSTRLSSIACSVHTESDNLCRAVPTGDQLRLGRVSSVLRRENPRRRHLRARDRRCPGRVQRRATTRPLRPKRRAWSERGRPRPRRHVQGDPRRNRPLESQKSR